MKKLILSLAIIFAGVSAQASSSESEVMNAIDMVRATGIRDYGCQVYIPVQHGVSYQNIEIHVVFASNKKDALAACLTKIEAGISHHDDESKVFARALKMAPGRSLEVDRILLFAAPRKP